MGFPKNIRDIIYHLLQQPTLDNFREFLHEQTGEHNNIDFKSEWITDAALAKEMLAIANSHGGIIVFGVGENEDKSINIKGLSAIKDKATVSNGIKKFISSNLQYEIYDFSYTTSEYEILTGKHFQMLVIEDTPEHIPFLAKAESGSLKQNMIYFRRGTSCEIANEEELQGILTRRINYMHPNNGESLKLKEHLEQLKILYGSINKTTTYYKASTFSSIISATSILVDTLTHGEKYEEINSLYPDEGYDEFIAKMITAKKKKIERVLDLY